MTAEIYGYAIVIAVLVGLAAASVEQLLAELGRPRRFAWLGAFVAALAFPPLAILLAPDPQLPVAAGLAQRVPLPMAARLDVAALLPWLWIGATTVLGLLYVTAWARLAWLARRWPRESTDSHSVVVADDVGPAVLGILAPRIVLPRWLMDGSPAVRSTVVAHELEHIAARDQASIVVAQVVTILLPWNLPLWWFARRLRAAIEIDCDARVLRRGADPAQYADVLLTVAQQRPSSPLVAATLIEPATQLERRIRIMLTTRRPTSLLRATAAAVVTAALAACATQLNPPVGVGSTAPAAAVTSIETTSTVHGAQVTRDADGKFTLLSGEILVRVADADQMRITSARLTQNGDESWLFEGDVRIDSDSTSITAARAVAKPTPDGGMVLTVEDAKVIRTFAAPATSRE